MNRAIDIFYFLAIPMAIAIGISAIYLRRGRWCLLTLCPLLVAAWCLTMQNRDRRYEILNQGWFESADALRSALGSPERIRYYEEGDELWTYSVRAEPWNTVQWYSIYKNHILAKSGGRKVGLFEEVTDGLSPRGESEAALARKNLDALDNLYSRQK